VPENNSRARRYASGAFCCLRRPPGVIVYPDDARLTAAQAADWFDVSPAAINGWFYRGHLTDVDTDEHGDRTYLFAELLAAEAKTRHHPNCRRKPQLLPV
jgi:hypothetical protein